MEANHASITAVIMLVFLQRLVGDRVRPGTTRRLSEMAWRNCILLHERLDVDRLADGRRRTKARLLDLRITQHSALLRRSRVRIDQADRRKSINAYCEAQMKVDNPHRDLLERFVF